MTGEDQLEWGVMLSYCQVGKMLALQQVTQSSYLHEGSSLPDVKYERYAQPNSQGKYVSLRNTCSFSLPHSRQMGRGWKVLLPAVISLWESDWWVILFLGCQGTGCSHANRHRGTAPL